MTEWMGGAAFHRQGEVQYQSSRDGESKSRYFEQKKNGMSNRGNCDFRMNEST